MNDEDFAREAFAAAFRSGPTGEPPTLPDVELLARHGRRANRNRHGLYAAGSTVLAGAAVAGIVTGPTLLGLGSPSPSDVGTGAQGTTTPPSSPAPSSPADDPAKPSPGVPCATQPTVNWLSVINGALPAGVTAAADHTNCVQMPDGSRSVEAMFTLSTGTVELQVTVSSGPDIAAKLGAAAGMVGIAPATDSPSLSLDPAAIASLDAQKHAMASAQETASPAPGTASGSRLKPASDQSCAQVGSDENACVSHLTKGSLSVVDVQLLQTGSAPLMVDVAASNGKDVSVAAAGQLPSDATMVAIAQAVAAHF
jgi:hypothetical protein